MTTQPMLSQSGEMTGSVEDGDPTSAAAGCSVVDKLWGTFDPWLNQDGVNEVIINRPGELFVEKAGRFERHMVAELTRDRLMAAVTAAAKHHNRVIGEAMPTLAATLPGGQRLQVVLPPLCHRDQIGIAIRQPTAMNRTLSDYHEDGSFSDTKVQPRDVEANAGWQNLLQKGRAFQCLVEAIKQRKTIVVSGGTSAGKTTLLNAMIGQIPMDERLVVIEDVEEVHTPHTNHLRLFGNTDADGGPADFSRLVATSLRLRPDRLVISEIRTPSVCSAFLEAVNTGHPGSVTTIHANSAQQAVDKMIRLAMRDGLVTTEAEGRRYIAGIVDVVVQINKVRVGNQVTRPITELLHLPGS